MPKVSVITAAYNQAAFIKETVESVQRQTFRDFEHIVVDDGSKDETGEILRSYGSRIRYIHQKNQGNVSSRNRGCELSQGKYIAILDGDDIWDEHKLEKQVDVLECKPELGFVYTGCYEIDAKGRKTSRLMFDDISDDPIRHQLLGNHYAYSSVMVRRSLLRGNTLVDPRFNLVGDRFLSIQIALQGSKIVGIPEGLVYIRTHGQSMRFSGSYLRNYLNQLLGLIRAVETDIRLPDYHKSIIRLAYGRAYYAAAWVLIERGCLADIFRAYSLLWKCTYLNPKILPLVIKQMAKGLYQSVRQKNGKQKQ
jgi:glycosyltransferase involved in cell wall biosynthesis